MNLLDPVLEQISKLRDRVATTPTMRWGTVTQANPMLVRLDADAAALPYTPASLVTGAAVGERVLCVEQNRRITVLACKSAKFNTDSGWMPLTLQTGWTALAGHEPRARLMNGVVHVEGVVLRGTGGSPTAVALVPAPLRLLGPKTTFFASPNLIRSPGSAATSLAAVLNVNESGLIKFDQWSNIDGNTGWYLPLAGSYVQDQRP